MLNNTLPAIFPELSDDILRKHTLYIEHLYQSKGPEFVVRYLKATQESLEKLLFKTSDDLRHEGVSIGKDRDGWPKWLSNGLKSSCIVEKDITSIRYVLTLCSTRRLITIRTLTNLDSITTPPTGSRIPYALRRIEYAAQEGLERNIKDFYNPVLDSYTDEVDKILTTKQPPLEISMKSGPNGITFYNFPWDRAAILTHNLGNNLLKFLKNYYQGDSVGWLEEKLQPYKDLVDSNRQLHVGKISLTFEGGKLKPRIFAMVDSLTQSLLRPLHDNLMRILTTIPEDCSFDHDKVVRVAKRLHQTQVITGEEQFYGFADLSNATDALYKGTYVSVGNVLQPGFGESWVQLFDRDFNVPASVKAHWNPSKPTVDNVRYSTGQPMGALSSWPFMALVHHCIVWAAFGGRRKSFNRYLLLGDDIVIFDREAYARYCSILDDLGLTYTNNISTIGFEFAKRMFFLGNEITGAYSSALWASRNSPELFALEWRTLATRGYSCGNDLPIGLFKYLRTNKQRFYRAKLLMRVPYGTHIKVDDLVKFCLDISGRSTCFLEIGDKERYVEALKAFRQAASYLIQQEFQKNLNDAKEAIALNRKEFENHFRTNFTLSVIKSMTDLPKSIRKLLKEGKVRKAIDEFLALPDYQGLGDQLTSIIQSSLLEYTEDGVARIRYLERDLKLTYLGGAKRKNRHASPEHETLNSATSPEESLRRFKLYHLTLQSDVDEFNDALSLEWGKIIPFSNPPERYYASAQYPVRYIGLSDKILLRPALPQVPRKINFKLRDNHVEKLKFRARHHLNIISMIRG